MITFQASEKEIRQQCLVKLLDKAFRFLVHSCLIFNVLTYISLSLPPITFLVKSTWQRLRYYLLRNILSRYWCCNWNCCSRMHVSFNLKRAVLKMLIQKSSMITVGISLKTHCWKSALRIIDGWYSHLRIVSHIINRSHRLWSKIRIRRVHCSGWLCCNRLWYLQN